MYCMQKLKDRYNSSVLLIKLKQKSRIKNVSWCQSSILCYFFVSFIFLQTHHTVVSLLQETSEIKSSMEDTVSPPVETTMAEDDPVDGALDGALEDDHSIDICCLCENKMKSPKILSCLHEFCEECLKKKLEREKEEENATPSSPLAKEWMMEVIKCPICEQKTRLPDKGISGLFSDTVLEDMIESDRGDKKQVSKFTIFKI